MKFPKTPAGWFALALSVLALLGISVGITHGDDGSTEVKIHIEGATGETSITADTDGEVELHQGEKGSADVHEDMADEKPPGVTAGTSQVLQRQAAKIPTADPLPPAGAQIYSCKRNLRVNRAPRQFGAVVSRFVVHWGVVPGNDQGLAIMARLFNNPNFKANSTFGLSPTGKCEQWAEFGDAPWTQLTFNQISESVEIAAMGNESRAWWMRQPIIKDGILAALIIDRLRARGLPLRWVDPVGCNARPAGWTDHNALECGNNHCDVTCGNFPRAFVAAQVASGVSSPAARRIIFPKVAHFGRKRQAWCTRLAIVRKNAKADEWTPKRVRVAEHYKFDLIGKGLTRPQAEKRAAKCRFV